MAQLSREEWEEGKEWHGARRTEPEWALCGSREAVEDVWPENTHSDAHLSWGHQELNTEGSAEGSDSPFLEKKEGRRRAGNDHLS